MRAGQFVSRVFAVLLRKNNPQSHHLQTAPVLSVIATNARAKLMSREKEIKVAFWRGILVGPLAIFPATFLLALASIASEFTLRKLFESLLQSLFVGLYGACIAYIVIIIYGSIIWYFLRLLNKLALATLLLAALAPALIVALLSREFVFSLLIAYYSLVVAFTAWFFGLRQVKKL